MASLISIGATIPDWRKPAMKVSVSRRPIGISPTRAIGGGKNNDQRCEIESPPHAGTWRDCCETIPICFRRRNGGTAVLCEDGTSKFYVVDENPTFRQYYGIDVA